MRTLFSLILLLMGAAMLSSLFSNLEQQRKARTRQDPVVTGSTTVRPAQINPFMSWSAVADNEAWKRAQEAAAAKGEPYQECEAKILVPSDPRASYCQVHRGANRKGVVIVSRRDGPSGTSYARRWCFCEWGTYTYLGEGDTLTEAMQDNMVERVVDAGGESISAYVCRFACAQR